MGEGDRYLSLDSNSPIAPASSTPPHFGGKYPEGLLRIGSRSQPLPALPPLCGQPRSVTYIWSLGSPNWFGAILQSSLQSTLLSALNVLSRGHWEKRALRPEPPRHHPGKVGMLGRKHPS